MDGKYLKKLKIYIVDDHKLFREGLKLLLSTQDFVQHIYEASNGKEFVENLSLSDCDVVLMDIEMPEIDGYQMLEMIRRKEELKEVPVLFLTSNHEKEHVVKAIKAGANDYIVKPVDEAVFMDKVRTLLKEEKYSWDNV